MATMLGSAKRSSVGNSGALSSGSAGRAVSVDVTPGGKAVAGKAAGAEAGRVALRTGVSSVDCLQLQSLHIQV